MIGCLDAVLVLPSLVVLIGFALVIQTAWSLGRCLPQYGIPLITSYIVMGAMSGPHVLNLIPEDQIRRLDLVDKVRTGCTCCTADSWADCCAQLALAFIAFTAGGKLFLRDLIPRMRAVAIVSTWLVALEAALGTVAVYSMASEVALRSVVNSCAHVCRRLDLCVT